MVGSRAPYPLLWQAASPGSSCLAGDLRSGDSDQVRGHDAPAHPSAEAIFPVVQTIIQALTPLQDADPPFDSGSKPESPSEPALPFVLPPFRGEWPLPGQHDVLDSELLGPSLVLSERASSTTRSLICSSVPESERQAGLRTAFGPKAHRKLMLAAASAARPTRTHRPTPSTSSLEVRPVLAAQVHEVHRCLPSR